MKTTQHIIVIILLLLWIPVSIDKLMYHSDFQASMIRQPFADSLGILLSYGLPVLEILTCLLLIYTPTARYGLMLSAILLLIFTAYIAAGLLRAWDKVPCGCGSVISGLSWQQHLWFNMFFLGISVLGLRVRSKTQRHCEEERRGNL